MKKLTVNDLAVDLFGDGSHQGDAGEVESVERVPFEPTEQDYLDHADMWKRLTGRFTVRTSADYRREPERRRPNW